MANTKILKVVEKVKAVRPGVLARFVVGETPSTKELLRYEKGETLEIEDLVPEGQPKRSGLAESLVREGRAEFVDPKRQKEFLDSETNRKSDDFQRGIYLNDAEMKEAARKQRLAEEQTASK